MLDFSLKLARFLVAFCVCFACAHYAEAQETLDADDQSAVIFTYFAVGNDDAPSASVTREQFTEQVEELTNGAYHVLPLPDIIEAFKKGKTLPDRTVAITFDGVDSTIASTAAPLLIEKKLPFTIFLPTDRVDTYKPPYLSWDDLRSLKETGLVSFGVQPANYGHLAGAPASEIKRQINNAIVRVREELKTEPKLFSYSYGEYDLKFVDIVKQMGFDAAFGQQSGVAYAQDNFYALPRFTITERYGDFDRFSMTANALPFPVREISPPDPRLQTLTPAIGFTVPDTLAKSVRKISCFSSGDEKPVLTYLNTRIEIRLAAIDEEKARLNCTMPVMGKDGEDTRWRWFGLMFMVPDTLLQHPVPPTPEKHAGDNPDNISIE